MQLGIYQHYKGKQYLVLGIAQHSETKEHLVVYVPLYIGSGPRMFVRPKKMFEEQIVVAGKRMPRFHFVGTEMPE